MDERPQHQPWEEDFGPEELLLLAHGFHRLVEDLWQLGSAGVEGRDVEVYTRQEALQLIRERMASDERE